MRIVLDIGSVEPLEGSVVVDGGCDTPFAGWLQLLTLLDRVMATADPVDPVVRVVGVPSRQPTGLGS